MNDVVQQVGERTFAEGLAGFAAYIRSTIRSGHVDVDDAEMFAKKFDAASAESTRLREALEAAVEVISGYEEWEASIILDTSCWSGDGFPHLNQSKFDRMLELQAARNAALAKARAALGLSSAPGAEAPGLRSPDPDR